MVRCTYILCIFIYIFYIKYCKLEFAVSQTLQKPTFHRHRCPYQHSNDTLMWPLAVSYTLHKVLTEVREQFARKVSENSYLAPIRASVGFRTIWRYKNDFEFGTWAQLEILYHLTYHGKYTQKGGGIVSICSFSSPQKHERQVACFREVLKAFSKFSPLPKFRTIILLRFSIFEMRFSM